MSIYLRLDRAPEVCDFCRSQQREQDIVWCPICGKIGSKDFVCCPIVEIPPHGRLIDADALMAKDEKDFSTIMEMTDPGTVFGTALADAHTAIQEMLKTAPTIIPAEGAE